MREITAAIIALLIALVCGLASGAAAPISLWGGLWGAVLVGVALFGEIFNPSMEVEPMKSAIVIKHHAPMTIQRSSMPWTQP